MPNFDTVLIDPTPEDRDASLAKAVRLINSRARVRKLAWPMPAFDKFVECYERERDGFRQWDGGSGQGGNADARSILAVAWWSDWNGRKHVRIAGRRGKFPPNHRQNLLAPRESRPAIWLIYPERLYLRSNIESRSMEAFAVCACGVTGTPKDIGWMGNECGPCHDRRESDTEVSPHAWQPARTILEVPDPVQDLDFSWNGKRLVHQMEYNERAYEWDLETLNHREFGNGWGWIWNVAYSPDRRSLFLVREHETYEVWDLERGAEIPQARMTNYTPRWIRFSPSGRFLAMLPPHIYGALRTFSVGDVETGDLVYESPTACVSSTNIVFCNESTCCYADRTRVVLYDFLEKRTVYEFECGERWIDWLDVSADGSMLAATDQHTRIHLWDLNERERLGQFGLRGVFQRQVVFSPEGKVLVSVGHDNSLSFWEVPSAEHLGRFCWHVDTIHALAFSPDGDWLATGSEDRRIKLWPWKALLSRT